MSGSLSVKNTLIGKIFVVEKFRSRQKRRKVNASYKNYRIKYEKYVYTTNLLRTSISYRKISRITVLCEASLTFLTPKFFELRYKASLTLPAIATVP